MRTRVSAAERTGVESARGLALARFAQDIRGARTREDVFVTVVQDVREALEADRVVLHRRDPLDLSFAEMVAGSDRGTIARDLPSRFPLADGWIERCLSTGDVVRIEALAPEPADDALRAVGIAALLVAPVRALGRIDYALAVHYAHARTFDEVDLVLVRGIAAQIEFALESRRLAELETLRRKRIDGLERTMLALREPREATDVLGIVARGLAHDFKRPCVAYEMRDRLFHPVVAVGTRDARLPIAPDRFEVELLRTGAVRRSGTRDIIGISTDGHLRALLAVEDAREPLAEDDEKYLRATGTHAALALSGALAFDQLRRYASEGAALKEAARTILGFTELRPLAAALSQLALRFVRAQRASIYAVAGDELILIGSARANPSPAPDRLALPPGGAHALFASRYSNQPYLAVPLRLSDDADGRTAFLIVRRLDGIAFGRAERRLIEALANLAQLALRNVELYDRANEANRALGESNAFKDDLLAMFAHDFKGPLTVISGFSELLLETETGETRANIETIIEQTRRLAKLADDALALAATQSAGFSLLREPDDLAQFVRECTQMLDRDGSRIELDLPREPVELLFDRSRLRHVVDNVVGNALKYSAGPVRVRVARAGADVVVDVSDSGIGIPAAELEKVFARYGRASNARSRGVSGSGVGLYIAKKIVDIHGGALTVVSSENEGSTFRIALPA